MARLFHSSCVFAAAAVFCSTAAPVSMQCEHGDDDAEQFGTDMMQKQRKFLPRSANVEDGLPKPIFWVHVPRTGASFAYTLLTMKTLCGEHRIPDTRELTDITVHYVQKFCFGINVDSRCVPHMNYGECSEVSIGGPIFSQYEGSIVGFFRQPEIRLLSDYKTDMDGREFTDWASMYLGCFTKKLAWNGEGLENGDWHCRGDAPTWDEVDLARTRVRNDYVFIGMTDDWNLSICLFNKMFGNTPRAIQFQNYGDHTDDENSSYDLSALNGFSDPYDALVWEVAVQIFNGNLQRYDVSEDRCEVPSE